MQHEYFISVCIPAYKRIDFLQRLFDSLAEQTFRDFEVIVADDSPDEQVKRLCALYEGKLPGLLYHKNPVSLGTPANWNKAISLARGKWIKLIHDDDWLAAGDVLGRFAEVAQTEEHDFIFSSYYDVYLGTGKERLVVPSSYRLKQLQRQPASLLSRNIIGPPSVILHRNDSMYAYDEKLKWLVDVDMYIRRLPGSRSFHIPEPLVKVGVGNDQVTAYTHGVAEVEIPEHFYFIRKLHPRSVRNIRVYDYWWRFIRNFRLRSQKDIEKYAPGARVPQPLLSMMRWQRRIPAGLLKVGLFSKTLMLAHYISHRKELRFD